ncbi:MAG: DUF3445 domain-containing protein [Pseudomonadota bacterium]
MRQAGKDKGGDSLAPAAAGGLDAPPVADGRAAGRIARDPERDIVLHERLASAPWDAPHTARLPGTAPLQPDDWLAVDEAYAAQMALRTRLIEGHRGRVIGALDRAGPALHELYRTVTAALDARPDFDVGPSRIVRPDGGAVRPDPADPLGTLGRLVTEDLCILEKAPEAPEHVLTAAVLCFPAHWSLAEKLGRPMRRIHAPVGRYTDVVARRVQRLLDGLAPGRMLMRMNALGAETPWLFTPGREADAVEDLDAGTAFLRSERQVFVRLPQSRAIVFSIQTRLLPWGALTPQQAAGAAAYLARQREAAAEAAHAATDGRSGA